MHMRRLSVAVSVGLLWGLPAAAQQPSLPHWSVGRRLLRQPSRGGVGRRRPHLPSGPTSPGGARTSTPTGRPSGWSTRGPASGSSTSCGGPSPGRRVTSPSSRPAARASITSTISGTPAPSLPITRNSPIPAPTRRPRPPGWRCSTPGRCGSSPRPRLVAFEAADTLDSFFPMQVIATRAETERVVAQSPGAPFLVFPEDRTHPIVMPADLPERWVSRSGAPSFSGTAFRGEFYAFQLGVWAATRSLADVRVVFEPLTGTAGSIAAVAVRCFNQGGVDWQGRDFTTQVDVAQGRIQPLWCGVQVPLGARPGEYRGSLTVSASGAAGVPVSLSLTVDARHDSQRRRRRALAPRPARLARLPSWMRTTGSCRPTRRSPGAATRSGSSVVSWSSAGTACPPRSAASTPSR